MSLRALVLTLCCLPTLGFAGEAPPPHIAVDGHAEVLRAPDQARLELAIEVDDAKAAVASSKAHEVASALVARVREIGVAEADIQSTSMRLAPRYRWDEERREQQRTGFRARRDITLTVRELDQLGALLQAANEAGVSHIAPPQLEHSQARALQREALTAAAADARANARALAEGLGVRLGAVLEVEMAQGGRPPQPVALRAASADSAPEMALEPGEISHSARVRARFAIIEE